MPNATPRRQAERSICHQLVHQLAHDVHPDTIRSALRKSSVPLVPELVADNTTWYRLLDSARSELKQR